MFHWGRPAFSWDVSLISVARFSSVFLVICACLGVSLVSSGVFSVATGKVSVPLRVSSIHTVRSFRLPAGVPAIVGIFTGCDSADVGGGGKL